jgi:hypothetical protein
MDLRLRAPDDNHEEWETGGMITDRGKPNCPRVRNILFPGSDVGGKSLTGFLTISIDTANKIY